MSAVPTSGALPRTYSILAGRYAATSVPLPTPPWGHEMLLLHAVRVVEKKAAQVWGCRHMRGR